jgi:hypothetical protein
MEVTVSKHNPLVTITKAPDIYDVLWSGKSIFLAGSIEMGAAVNWQDEITDTIAKNVEQSVNIYNPRREEWDSSWEQDINNPQFYEQVTWELSALEHANIIALYLDPNTKSPISLLELGIHINDKDRISGRSKLVVCCPEGFWRKGNVDVTCQRFGVQCFSSKEAWTQEILNRLRF